mmetsp:Transcript_26363/g.38815  ORF Transcript_26363/g.38815 Transcript_26363/m.38815 type:complete len:448 (-) Transcript_26363:1600-2943(-)
MPQLTSSVQARRGFFIVSCHMSASFAIRAVLLMVTMSVCLAFSTFRYWPVRNTVGAGSRNVLISRGAESLLLKFRNSGSYKATSSSPLVSNVSLFGSTSMSTSTTDTAVSLRESRFLHEVDTCVETVLDNRSPSFDILNEPPSKRQSIGVANRLRIRLDAMKRNNDCPRCWLQRAHCVCDRCPPLEEEIEAGVVDQNDSQKTIASLELKESNDVPPRSALPGIRRLFLLMHHKEIGLVVDTAKMILRAFPNTARLVVAGIGEEYQPSMAEMIDSINGKGGKCVVLFPADGARTFHELQQVEHIGEQMKKINEQEDSWDIIVIDGTWAQARQIHGKYIPSEEEGGPPRVQLSDEALKILSGINSEKDMTNSEEGTKTPGLQLRRHPIKWKEISTLEATRLLLRDYLENVDSTATSDHSIKPWEALAAYQRMADDAARKQLGPQRKKQK